MALRKHETADESLAVDTLAKAAAAFIRDQVDVALTERLRALRAGEGRRSPQTASAPESLGPQYLTRQQVAQITGYSARTITRMIDTGRLRACGPRRDRVTRAEVDRMMATAQDDDFTPPPLNAAATQIDPDADVTAAVDRLMSGK